MAVKRGQNGAAASRRAFAALAVLKVNWDERRDYIGNFLPLVAHCLRGSDTKVVSLPDVQESVLRTFGLRIPQGPLKTILGRAARDGLVDRTHNVYEPNGEALAELTLDPTRESVLRQHAHLVQRLRSFAEERGRSWTEEQADRALLAYVEVLAEPILGAVVEGEPVVELPHIDAEGAAVVSQYVLDLCRNEPEAFEYLETVVKGSMLANVLYFPEAFSGGKPRLGHIDIYLDTRVALRVLGYAEDQFREPAVELVELLRGQGASLKLFDHTLREVEGVLDGAAQTYRTGRSSESPGDIVDFFASQSLTASDVQALIASLDERLDAHGIEVVPASAQTEELAVDETALEKLLNEEVLYRRREPLLRDLDSLTGIHRIRKGEIRRRIERCDALFVTTNLPLVRASKMFFDPLQGGAGVPLAVLDSRLAAIAWLMNPVQAADLPRKQIVATSYAALNPAESVWRKYLAEIRKLATKGGLTEDQVSLLVFSPEARLELMNATDGKADAVTEGTVPQILEHARHVARAEVVAELEEEKRRREEAEATISEEKRRAAEATAAVSAAIEAHADKLGGAARRLARGIGWAAFVVVLVLVVGGTAFATSGVFPDDWSKAVPFVTSLLVWIALIVGVGSLAFGASLTDIVRFVERQLQPPIQRRLVAWFGPPSAGSARVEGSRHT